MGQEKDRLGDKLREVERGREDQYFAERDRELIKKLRQEKDEAVEAVQRETSLGRCPRCGAKLVERRVRGLAVDDCPSCGGIWLDRGEFEELARQEKGGWLGRLLGLPD
jgi:ribosomal protein L37AE/L43A